MSDFFMRGDAPLSAEEWEKLDEIVIKAARQLLVGRRFVELVGPLGVGTEVVPVGTGESRKQLDLQMIQEDFKLSWRDIEGNRAAGLPPDLGVAAKAGMDCACQEDKIVLGGLLKGAGNSFTLGDWSVPGNAFADVVKATEKLVQSNCFGPYAVVLSPALYTQTQRVVEGIGRLESKLIKDVAQGGLFQTPVLGEDQGLVLSLGSFNFDLVVGQDLITAYMGNEGLDHLFRLLESIVLRVKRPGAICALGK
jgi:uncharacterized linocin/CFP29 family protein